MQANKIPAFLVWCCAVVYGDKAIVSRQQEWDFRLVAAGPVGEGVSFLSKLLGEKCFGAGGVGDAFLA